MKLTTLKSIAATTVLAVLSISCPLAAQESAGSPVHYSVIDLGTLGGSASNGYGGVNNRGWVTGDANLPGDQNEHAFLWRQGVMTDLGTLGGPNSSVGIPVKDDRGLIVGNAQTATVDPLGEFWGSGYFCTAVNCQGWQNLQSGFLWQNGSMTALPTLGGNNSEAFGVNNRGQVVGIAETATQDPSCALPQVLDFEAVIWGPKAGQIQELPPLQGDSVGAALGINGNGQVVGCSGSCGPVSYTACIHATLWRDGSVTDLGSFGGAMNNAANAINSRGQVVGLSDLPGDTTAHAFFWQHGVMTDLGALPGDAFSMANDINSNGQVIGVSCADAFFDNCRAFLWENGVMTDLNTLIPPDSPLYLTFGGGINDGGEIAGSAFDQKTSDAPAFLAIPVAGSSAAQPSSSKPKVTLPENVRKRLQRRIRFPRP